MGCVAGSSTTTTVRDTRWASRLVRAPTGSRCAAAAGMAFLSETPQQGLESLFLPLDFASWVAFFPSLSLSLRQGIEQGLSKGMAVPKR
jgi:hypothetical protein